MEQNTPDRSVERLPRGHRLRGAAEECAARIYAARYGARLQVFPDMMAALRSTDGAIGAVAGVRLATGGFFSESLSRRFGRILPGENRRDRAVAPDDRRIHHARRRSCRRRRRKTT